MEVGQGPARVIKPLESLWNFRSNGVDKRLIGAATLLLFLEIFWLLGDLGIIVAPWKDFSASSENKKVVGLISDTKQEVRQRRSKSIIWEESKKSNELYYYDSILTLSKSSATVELEGSSKIELSENTLIVIEPPEKTGSEKLKLRFSKGNVRAKMNGAGSEINTGSWVIEAQAGSEIAVRGTSEQDVEVEVLKGKASMSNSEKTVQIEENKIISVQEKEIQSEKNITDEIQWNGSLSRRSYIDESSKEHPLEWTGSADQLWYRSPAGEVSTLEILKGAKDLTKDLGLGAHQFRLMSGDKVSQTLTIEVWKKPKIQLLYPLPRDRISIGHNQIFSWRGVDQVSNYRLEFAESLDFLKPETAATSANSFTNFSFEKEGSLFWRVVGVDNLGVEVNSIHINPIFSVEEPLEAPRLKTPNIRTPAKEAEPSQNPPSSSLWSPFIKFLSEIFFSSAQAQNGSQEIVFDWEPVPGAKKYIIEIDEMGDFRNPIVISETLEPAFTLKNINRKIFWRVAAESASGKKGRFSEPNPFDPSAVSRGVAGTDGLEVKLKPANKKTKQVLTLPAKKKVFEAPAPPRLVPITESKVIEGEPPPAVVKSPPPEAEPEKFQEPEMETLNSMKQKEHGEITIFENKELEDKSVSKLAETFLYLSPPKRERSRGAFWLNPRAMSISSEAETEVKATQNGFSWLNLGFEYNFFKVNDLNRIVVRGLFSKTTWKKTDANNPFQKDIEESRLEAAARYLFSNFFSAGLAVQSRVFLERSGLESLKPLPVSPIGGSVGFSYENGSLSYYTDAQVFAVGLVGYQISPSIRYRFVEKTLFQSTSPFLGLGLDFTSFSGGKIKAYRESAISLQLGLDF